MEQIEIAVSRRRQRVRPFHGVGDGPISCIKATMAQFLIGQSPGFMRSLINCRSGSAVLQQVQQRQRCFALPEVPPQCFAQMFAVGSVVQRVIRQLECNAQPLSGSGTAPPVILPWPRRQSRRSCTRPQSIWRSYAHDAEIFRFRHQRIAVVIQLKHFAFGHLPAGFRECFVDALVTEVDDLADGP